MAQHTLWLTGFDGPYAEFLSEYGSDLRVRVNVLVRPVDEQHTRLRVHARYVFGSYTFESNSRQTRRALIFGKVEDRTCRPTHLAESVLIGAGLSM